jgi:antitoxin HigA-1
MLPNIDKVKGVHPGAVLKREIEKRGLKNKELARMVDEHAQTISAIIKEKRGVTPKLSIKLGANLGVSDDYFMLLQASYEVKQAYLEETGKRKPDLKHIRRALFWDTDYDKIDWTKNRAAIIRRIFERGNDQEINEVLNFYGFETVESEIGKMGGSRLPAFEQNIEKYLNKR